MYHLYKIELICCFVIFNLSKSLNLLNRQRDTLFLLLSVVFVFT